MNISDIRQTLEKERHLKGLDAADSLIRSFSLFEKVVFFGFAGIMAVSAFVILAQVQAAFLIEIPRQGGSLREGIVGSPRFINPLLATTDADRDLTALVHAGLLKTLPDGRIVPELAESYEVIDGGASYIFVLRHDARFHDGTPVTADDVIYTIERAQDPNLKSPRFASWTNVAIEKIDERTVKLTPKGIYAPFLINATMGIIPKSRWKDAGPEQFPFSTLNIEPIGAGPYRVERIEYGKSGVPIAFALVPFEDYALGAPYIESLEIRFYPNEQDLVKAYQAGVIESMGSVSPEIAASLEAAGTEIAHSPLLRVFGVYFNKDRAAVLANKEVRAALASSIDRDRIVSEILKGYATAIGRPVPPGLLPARQPSYGTTSAAERIAAARLSLEKKGWEISSTTDRYSRKSKTGTEELAFSIAVPDAPELKAAAAIIVEDWRALGAAVDVAIYESGDLQQNVIRPRKYDALLFGQIVGRDLDLYPFWHSSQRNDPGYNIALYANVQADKLLEEGRREIEPEKRSEIYMKFEDELLSDIPAAFLYAPDFIYALPSRVEGTAIREIAVPAERFSGIADWYVETDRVWKPIADLVRR